MIRITLHECPACGARAVTQEELNVYRCNLCGESFNEQEMGEEDGGE